MATKLKVNYEFVGDSTTPVTRTESIKHGDSMLSGVITSAVTALGTKADKSYVDSQDALKANKAEVDAVLATKANAADVTSGLAAKADSTTVSAIASRVSTNETNIATQTARIDEIAALPEGSTSGDAELMDIRVGADSVTYTSAGAAVRAQITDVKSDVRLQRSIVPSGILTNNTNFNDTPSGTEYFVSYDSTHENNPLNNEDGMLSTLNYSNGIDGGDAKIQILIARSGLYSRMYARNSWSNWKSHDNTGGDNPSFTDFDSAPISNKVYRIDGVASYQHAPVSSGFGLLFTYSYDDSKPDIAYQRYVEIADGGICNTYERARLLASQSWGSWKKTGFIMTGGDNPSFTDFDSAPISNKVYRIDGVASYQHAPVSSGFGLLFTYSYDDSKPDIAYQRYVEIADGGICNTYERVRFLASQSWGSWKKLKYDTGYIEDGSVSTCVFIRKWGFIGDSLTEGQIVTNAPSTDTELIPAYSWGKQVEYMLNSNSSIWGSSGNTARGIYELFIGGSSTILTDKRQVYVYCIGQNDVWAIENTSLYDSSLNEGYGDSSSININNYNLNANTFVGWVAKMIQRIRVENPNCVFVLMNTMLNNNRRPKATQALRDVSDTLDNVFFFDNTNYYHLWQNCDYGHLTASGYGIVAETMLKWLSVQVKENPKKFMKIVDI